MTDILGPASAPNAVTTRPTDGRSFGGVDTWFKNCTSPDAEDGTDFQAEWFNGMMAVLRKVVRMNGLRADGVTPIVIENGADDELLVRSLQQMIQRGQEIFSVDTGVANALVATLAPAALEYKSGMHLFIRVAADNNGASKINVNGLGDRDIVRRDGSLLLQGDLLATHFALIAYNAVAGKFELISPYAQAAPANLTIYVNGTLGNDANDGSANIAGRAMATTQAAINRAFGYGPGPNTITVKIADGTYAGFITPARPGPTITVEGNITTPANVLLNGGSAAAAVMLVGPNTMLCRKFKVTTGTPGIDAGGFVAISGGVLTTEDTESGFIEGPVFEGFQATCNAGSHKFSGNIGKGFWSNVGGLMSLRANATFTIGAAISVGTAFAYAVNGGSLTVSASSPNFVSPGLVTGKRFFADLNGIIYTNGSGASFFPGTVAGSVTNGGQYA